MNSNHFLLSAITIFTFASYLCVCDTHQEEANHRANEGSMTILANLPRASDTTELNIDVVNDDVYLQDYVKGIISLVIIPFVFVALSMALCPIWTICRCCGCCCCKKRKPEYVITKFQIYSRFFIVLGCCIAIVAMAAIAYAANVDFSGALLYNEGEGEEGNLFGVVEELMADGVNKTMTIHGLTVDIYDGVIYAVDGVQLILGDTSVLSQGTAVLIAMLNSISALWSDYQITTTYNGEDYTYSCEFCTTIGTTIGNITNEVETQIGPIFSDLNTTINEIDSALIDTEASILESIQSFVDQIQTVGDELQSAEDEVQNQRPDIASYNDQRELAYNIIFAIPLLPIIFILFGGILKKPACFSLSYICLWFSCSVMWFLLAVHLPIAVLLYDTCNFLEVVDSDVTATFNNTQGLIFEACLTDERLTDVLGLGSSLNFTNMIEFPSLGNIAEQFQLSDLISFEDDALATNFTTFYADGDEIMVSINNITSISPNAGAGCCYYERWNVSTLNATEYYPYNSTLWQTLEYLRDAMEAESQSIAAFNDTIYKIRANLSSVSAFVEGMEGDIESLANNVDNASLLLNPLFDTIEDMIDEATCGFIGEAYFDTKDVMCVAVLGSLARIVVAMFVIAILSLFGCLWTVTLVRKVHWLQVQKHEEKERKIQQSFQPNRPSVVVMQPLMQNTGYPQPGGNIQPILTI